MTEVSLYYPYIEPPVQWIKQSMLISDELTSMVPSDFEHPESQDIQWLQSEGYWSPSFVPYLDASYQYIDEVETALLEFASDAKYRWSTDGTNFPQRIARIRLGKLTQRLESAMSELDLAIPDKSHNGLLVHEQVAGIVLAITAQYLAAERMRDNRLVIPSTDSELSRLYATKPLRGLPQGRRYELLLQGILPVPDEHTSLPDIADFRKRHTTELLALQLELHELVVRIGGSQEPDYEIRAARKGIELAVNNLRKAARSKRLGIFAGAAVLLTGAAVGQAMDSDTVKWAFDGIAGAGTLALASVAARSRPAFPERYSYLLKAEQAFGSGRT